MNYSRHSGRAAWTALPLRVAAVIAVLAALTAPSRAQFGIDASRRYDQNTYLGTHNAYAYEENGFALAFVNQRRTLKGQLDEGVRYINLDVWLVRQGWSATFPWVEIYQGEGTDVPGFPFHSFDPLEVVVAHSPDTWQYVLSAPPDFRFKKLSSMLQTIREWLEDNPEAVVTLGFENKIHISHQDMVWKAFTDSRLDGYVFYPDRGNPAVPAPEGFTGGWDIRKFGYPALNTLVNQGKRLVLLPDDGRRGVPNYWNHQVNTDYGGASLNSDTWTNPREDDIPINDFTRFLFLMEHAPDFSLLQLFNRKNDIDVLRERWTDMKTRWQRLPHFFTCDFFDFDFDHFAGWQAGSASDPSGPMRLVTELNAEWAAAPAVSATPVLQPVPNAFGWNNTGVSVNGWTISGDSERADGTKVVSTLFGAQDSGVTVANGTYSVDAEGVTTLSFAAIGSRGNRGNQQYLSLQIDKTRPSSSASLARQPNAAGWFNEDVTFTVAGADNANGSGFQLNRWRMFPSAGWSTSTNNPASVLVSTEGVNAIAFGTLDRADNESAPAQIIVRLDKAGPVITAAADPPALWPPNGKVVPVTVSGTITDATSGVDLTSAVYSVSDEYGRVQPSGPLVIAADGSCTITIGLEARRDGTDRDGRAYHITLRAQDIAGNTSAKTITVIVSHDQRND